MSPLHSCGFPELPPIEFFNDMLVGEEIAPFFNLSRLRASNCLIIAKNVRKYFKKSIQVIIFN